MMMMAPVCAAAAKLPLAWTAVEVFWLFCWLLVLWQAWLGWRSGLFRQMAAVVGLIAGWVIGLSQGPALFAHFWTGSGLPSFILVPLASMFLGLIVYGLAVLAGRLLFKRACDHPIGPTRLFLGVGGAAVGTGLGLFGVWIVIAVARLAGAVAQIGVPSPDASETRAIRPDAFGRDPVGARLAQASAPALVRIQYSVETGVVGAIVKFTDPFPKGTYADVHNAALIATDTGLQERLLNAPSLHAIATDPKVMALRQDPAVLDAWQRHDFTALASNPRFVAAMQDQRLARRLEKVDITRALNETIPAGTPAAVQKGD
jgi:hypothetical protein